jgi:hypothetical protein
MRIDLNKLNSCLMLSMKWPIHDKFGESKLTSLTICDASP